MACVTVLNKSWDWCQAEADEVLELLMTTAATLPVIPLSVD